MINLILIWALSNNFNRFLKSWCELTWKEMLLRRGKPNPFPLFTGLPGWMCKALVKSLHKILWMIWGKIGWANKYLGDDIWLDKHIQDIYNKQISGDTPGEMWMTWELHSSQPRPCPALLMCLLIIRMKKTLMCLPWYVHCCPNADVLDARYKSLKDFGWLKGWLETNKMTFYRGKDKSRL